MFNTDGNLFFLQEKENLQKKLDVITEENSLLEVERSNLTNGFSGIKRILSSSSLELANQSIGTSIEIY